MQKLRSESRLVICKPASLPIPILLAFTLFLNFSLVCAAGIIEVPENYSTIQSAIDAAFDGDEIIVSPGTYYENINFLGKNIILRSTEPTSPTVVASTIIDGNEAGSVVTFAGTELATCVLSGFTITNGWAGCGGGIFGNVTLATIRYNNIKSNIAQGYDYYWEGEWHFVGGTGGGLYDCDGTIQNNIITLNHARGMHCFGGGLYDCDGTIQGNTITKNWAVYDGSYSRNDAIQEDSIYDNMPPRPINQGGGLYRCDGIIRNNIIFSNSRDGLFSCDGTIQNNTIAGNTFGLYGCKGFINNCIVWGNSVYQINNCSTPSYSCIQNWTGGGRGNISSDPRFVDPTNRDYHLQSDSPCIDAGENVTGLTQDFEGDPRPYDAVTWESRGDGSDFDIGADEYIGPVPTPTPTPTPCIIYVPADYTTIQEAIDVAQDGCEIIVSPGTYYGNVNFNGKNIILRSTDPTNEDIIATTIIDGNQLDSVVSFFGTELTTCVLSGFTITNGYAPNGGGICGNGTLATIQYNIIISNTTYGPLSFYGYGGGVYDCDGTIQSNTISDNTASTRGGGLGRCDGTIQGNGIFRNSAGIYGGGFSECNGIIQNNTVSNNSAKFGGGLYDCIGTIQDNLISSNAAAGSWVNSGGGLIGCDGIIQNNTILENTATHGGGLSSCRGRIQHNLIAGNSVRYKGGGLYNCHGTIQNNRITGNTAGESGGGLAYCYATIQNNLIANNSAEYGGGGVAGTVGVIYIDYISGKSSQDSFGRVGYTKGILQNNTITNNSAEYGGGIYLYEGFIINCIIWQNAAPRGAQLDNSTTPSYSCIQDWTGGTGNISSDPQLVDPDNGDFHLQPTSPCIDAGGYVSDLDQDFEGDPRPWDGTSEPRGDGSDFDIGADEYIGSIGFDFTISREEWTTGTAVVFSPPQWVFEPGRLKLISQNNTNTFGFWVSPENAIPVTKGYLYRARFMVSTDVTDQADVPWIRLRANSLNLQQYDVLSIVSNGDGGASPAASGTDYDLYFVPPSNETAVMLAFDLLNFFPNDAAVAELALDSVIVTRFALDSLSTPTVVQDYTFELSQDGWTAGGAPAVFTSPESVHSAGALELRATTNTNTFGFWGNNPADITIEASKLYRGTFEIRTDVTNPAQVPEMRMRFNTGNLQALYMLGITSAGDGANSPGTTNTTYDRMYFLPPANCVGESLLVSFDILNFAPDDAPTASLILDRAIIETLSPPASP